jgi:hypothetical protein
MKHCRVWFLINGRTNGANTRTVTKMVGKPQFCSDFQFLTMFYHLYFGDLLKRLELDPRPEILKGGEHLLPPEVKIFNAAI